MAMNTYENSSSESRDDDLRRTILNFVSEYSGNDPLEPWLRCIKWLKEMNPPGNVQVVLKEVLELTGNEFLADNRYKSDLRYLRVWIQYADCCVDRGGIFPFLEANGIGLGHGLFYEAYAMLLESSRDFAKADYVFQLGISRGAQPLERVMLMYNNFRGRMLARQKRKQRQEQELKALLARGAQRPLSGSNGIQGLPTMPPFQNSAREDPLPDMQVSVGGYNGPAPVLIGSKIYESTAVKAESSFEEERMRHWVHNKSSQLRSATYNAPVAFNNVQNMSNSIHTDTRTRVNEVNHNPYRPGIRMDSMPNQMPGQKTETSNGFRNSVPKLSQSVRSSQPADAGNVLSNDSFGGEKHLTRPATSSFVTAVQQHRSLPLPHRDLPQTGRSHTNENLKGMERNGNLAEPAGHSENIDDVTIVTKSVTDDIMAMFADSRPASLHSETTVRPPSAHENSFKTERSYTNENVRGMERNCSSGERAGQSKIVDDATIMTKSVTDDIMAMFSDPRETSSRSEAVAQEYASPLASHRGMPKIEKSYTNENLAGTVVNVSSVQRPGQSEVLDDLTMDSKSVTDDIMSMFSDSFARKEPGQRGVTSSFAKTTVPYAGTQKGTPPVNGGLRAPVAPNQPVRKSANASAPHNSPSTSIPSDSESRTLNVAADYKGITASIQQQSSHIAVGGKSMAAEGVKPEASAHTSWSSDNQVHNKAATIHPREFVSVHKDVASSSTSAVDTEAPPNQKSMEQTAVGLRITKESRGSIPDEHSKPDQGTAQGRSCGKNRVNNEYSVYDDSSIRSTSSRKRSSWSTSAKGSTHCIYLSDEEEKIDNRDNKKQKVQVASTTFNEGSGVRESGTPVMDRSDVTREQQPSQYSPIVCSTPSKSITTFKGSTSLQRNILEPTLSRTEHRKKPGGQLYPWEQSLLSSLLKELDPPLSKYKGYIYSSKKYSGKVSLATFASTKPGVKNKPLELGCSKYQLKGCTGRGAFAQVYLADALHNNGDSHRVVLKVQKPPCPWEFYIYRQLDVRILSEERCSYGCAQNIHIYADCSFMECDFGQYGTLQDVINSYLSKGQRMDEALCIFYTIEMLHMLENLHKVGLIHGDFKPDNLLIRSSSENLGVWTPDKSGSWKQQGVCLIDWGRSIDLTLFAEGTEFVGDSKTDGFRCTEMIEKKPWTFQVDTYGLCGVAHCLLHGNYMEIDKRSSNGAPQVVYRPKAPYKRYWNVNLWQNFFETLLNLKTDKSYDTLNKLRRSFEDYLCSDSALTKKLRDLLTKQNTMLLSRK